nr:MAG TPA: hypothetical protein [Caudoviricetes sp.]
MCGAKPKESFLRGHPSECLRISQEGCIIRFLDPGQFAGIIFEKKVFDFLPLSVLGLCCENCTDFLNGDLLFLCRSFRFWSRFALCRSSGIASQSTISSSQLFKSICNSQINIVHVRHPFLYKLKAIDSIAVCIADTVINHHGCRVDTVAFIVIETNRDFQFLGFLQFVGHAIADMTSEHPDLITDFHLLHTEGDSLDAFLRVFVIQKLREEQVGCNRAITDDCRHTGVLSCCLEVSLHISTIRRTNKYSFHKNSPLPFVSFGGVSRD